MTYPIPEFLHNNALRLILFGGKGGVGKTTMAAAAALHLAASRGEAQRILVISTDPAHSLSDAFGVEIGDRVTPIQEEGGREQGAGGREQGPEQRDQIIQHPSSRIQNPESRIQNLFARELDARRLLDAFKQKNHDIMQKLAERGTYFDEEDIAGFLGLSLPGMDEVMAIMEIAGLLRDGAYDLIILDTAPTGHTVRMLDLPQQMLKWIEILDLMQRKHRYLSEVFSKKKYQGDVCDRFLEDLSSSIHRVRRLLSDEKTSRFVPVLIPEPMSISETGRLMEALKERGIPVKEMIVNRVTVSEGCAFCRERKEDQLRHLRDIETRFSSYERITIPEFPHEIRGISGLRTIADVLSEGRHVSFDLQKRVQVLQAPAGCLALDPGLEFVLVCGKGGVGKTTLASATALHLAECHFPKKVLLFSTDPAHSLSDSLNQSIGDAITRVQRAEGGGQKTEDRGQMGFEGKRINIQHPKPKTQNRTIHDHRMTMNDSPRSNESEAQSPVDNDPGPVTNLYALEIDADRLWGEFKETFRNDVQALFDRFVGRGVDIRFDREAMIEIIELAPPGLDEIMALNRIIDLKNEGEFDIFVLDTSPTGHLLRFLEMPDLAREWLNTFFGLLLKYKGVVRLTAAAEKALSLARNVRRIQEALTNPQKTGFVALTIAEAMGVLELERLMNALERGNVCCRHIVVNQVVPETECGFCSIKRAEQQKYVRKIGSIFPDRTIVQGPLFPRQISGVSDLAELGRAVFCKAVQAVATQ